MNLLDITNDVLEVVKEPTKFEMAFYSLIAATLILATFWVISKIVKFVFKIFRKK